MGSSAVRLALFALCAGAAGCATMKSRAGQDKVVVAGVWEGMSQSTLKEGVAAGDTRIERQAWRLDQRGDTVSGFYVVEVTMISGDGRPYLCSREPRFSTLLKFDVRGKVAGNAVDLEEVGDVKAKGPCRPTVRTPSRYRAALRGDGLTITDGERHMPLHRRDQQVEREAWPLVQEGNTIPGYYAPAVHHLSTAGHASRCSAALDFR